MTDEPVTGDVTPAPAANPPVTATDTTPPSTDTPATEAVKPEEPEKPKQTPWFQKRIDELTREKWEARREAEAARSLAEALKTANPDTPTPQDPQLFERMVAERAQKLVEAQRFDESCNTTYQRGKEKFPDFDESVSGYTLLGGLQDKRDFLEAVTALPNGEAIFYHLGKNLDEASRVLALPPIRMAVELTRLGDKLKAAPAVSKAPAPVKPISGAGKADGYREDMPIEEFFRWREAKA
ncbi:MAG TPA: hypothetical protein PLD10_07170 [Rhodopila sp.]|nr:hypothetical protein [Rhodopila sp.]